jgi:pimeloyl-ACP methyl ester carboxylesterase
MILNTSLIGEVPPVILMHGLFGAAKNLGVISRALGTRARVIAMDMRNHGFSPHDSDMSYAAMAADVVETAAAHGVQSAAVIGHSMGGKTAMFLALQNPDFVESLAVLDIAPVAYSHEYDDYVLAMQDIDLSPALTRHAADEALQDAVPAAPMRAFLLNNLVLGDAPRWRVALPEIAVAMPHLVGWTDPQGWQPFMGKALFLRGADSHYVQPGAYAAITARFPAATIASVTGASHWLHADKPAEVIADLEEFLQS